MKDTLRYIEEEKFNGYLFFNNIPIITYEPYHRRLIMKKEDEIDAVVTVTEEKNTMALANQYQPQRHMLRVGKDKKFTKKIEKELKLDAKLGLHKISEDTARKALIHDIDQLTSSKDYYPITKKQLHQLFKIKQLNLMYCLPFNIIEKVKAVTEIFFGTAMCQMWSLLTIICATITMVVFQNTHWEGVAPTVGVIIGAAASLVFTVLWFTTAFNVRYGAPPTPSRNLNTEIEYRDGEDTRELKRRLQNELNRLQEKKEKRTIYFTSIKAELDLRPLKETDIEIPYGAKLKAEEAFDSKIFEALVIAHPKFTVQKNSIEIKEKIIPRINLDPAICGVTADDRLFMIVYWDVKKDIEKTAQKIKKFRKFKLKT